MRSLHAPRKCRASTFGSGSVICSIGSRGPDEFIIERKGKSLAAL
jgi:hypothetical protein